MLVCEHRSHKRMSGCHAALTESDRSVRKLSSLMEVISAFPHARDVLSYGPAAGCWMFQPGGAGLSVQSEWTSSDDNNNKN